jgi:hypothetical protein
MTEIRACWRCGDMTQQEIIKKKTASGVFQVGWWCLDCDGGFTGDGKTINYYIPHAKLVWMGLTLESLREIEPNYELNTCVVCKKLGAEYHHWAPQALEGQFKEPNKWPGAYLCKPHHDEWHSIVTPDLRPKAKQQEAND